VAQRDLNFAVGKTIDRLVFLRICEDRGIEPYGRLQDLANAPNIYRRLAELFQRADERYNSGLFHFNAERDRPEAPDELTLGLSIDDKPLKEIIRNLYYPDSPYEFSVLPAEILGQVYEQFLGKVIRLTKGGQAKVEEKPEVRKAGGVYYTPAYIVEYIVQHTVGRLLEERTPQQAAKLRILDPACGSGSFLIGAYQHLLDWHRDRYIEKDAEKHARGRAPRLYRGPAGDWRLTTGEKRRILLNNIYGVDIDPQAVEVTKLSLLLKVLEGESQETIANQLRLFHERALPDLAANIKCGNSLIGPDLYAERQMTLLQNEEKDRINVLDWKAEFSQVLRRQEHGFDAVIGNPPWVMAGYYVGAEIEYLRRKYQSAAGKFDLYYLFVELGAGLVSDAGWFGMIVPNKFFHTRAAQQLRAILSAKNVVHTLVDFGYERVFAGATNYSCIMLLRKTPTRTVTYARAGAGLAIVDSQKVRSATLTRNTWHFIRKDDESVFRKMEAVGVPLETIVRRFGTGVQTGADKILCVDAERARQLRIEKAILRPILRGRNVRRYQASGNPRQVVFPYTDAEDEFRICDEDTLRTKYPRAHSYLLESKDPLSKRVWFGKNATQLSGKWYGMMYLDSRWAFTKPHLLTPSLSNRSNFALGEGTLFATGTAGVTSVIPKDTEQSVLYLLGLLNSSVMSWYAVNHSPVFQGAYFKFSAPYLKRLPVRTIDFSVQSDKAAHDRIVEHVESIVSLRRRLGAARAPHDRTAIRRQIDATDRQIDRLVYDLYGLTDEEIRIVEQATAPPAERRTEGAEEA
jgi:type I restriction-modification system DNA methylase subunit